jgi:prepilin-type N-terminal cleavage/methylation domain-containing protein
MAPRLTFDTMAVLATSLPTSPRRGFTLIEMAVVLVLIAIGLTFALRITVALRAGAQFADTRKAAENIKNALVAYAVVKKRLPCPADGTLGPASANYGLEARDPATDQCLTRVNPADPDDHPRGVVPWRTLGIGQESADDAWFRRFTYHVTTLAAERVAGQAILTAVKGQIDVYDREVTASAVPINRDVNNNNSGALLILVSHGSEGAGAFVPGNATRLPVPVTASPATVENTNGDRNYNGSQVANETLLYVSPVEFAFLLNAASPAEPALPQAVTMKAIEALKPVYFPSTVVDPSANAITPGGVVTKVGDFPVLTDVPLAMTRDAWGNPLRLAVFNNFGVGTNLCTVPTNATNGSPVYGIRSGGPDYLTTATDDTPSGDQTQAQSESYKIIRASEVYAARCP